MAIHVSKKLFPEEILMKDKIFVVLQRIGRSFMLPIAILPVAGLPEESKIFRFIQLWGKAQKRPYPKRRRISDS